MAYTVEERREYNRKYRIANPNRLREWRAKNPDKVRAALERQRDSGYFAKYAKKNSWKYQKRFSEWRKKNRVKHRAWSKIWYHILSGKLIRPEKCEKCMKHCKPQAHHWNGYENALDVKWLCRPCHIIEHHPRKTD